MLGFKILKPEDRPKLFEYFRDYKIIPPIIIVTNDQILNAYGGFPKIVLITSKMLDILSDKELFAVLLHEIGHKNSNLKYYLGVLLPLYLMALYSGLVLMAAFIKHEAYVPFIYSVILFIGIRTGMPAAISWYLRKAEFQADCYASKVLQENKYWLITALRKSEDHGFGDPTSIRILLLLMLKPFEKTHPSIEERIRNIQNC